MNNKVIALTGGIGSGKSFVSKCLKEKGIEVFDCDTSAKWLMKNNAQLRQKLIALIGKEAYINGELNKPFIANFLLEKPQNTQALNNIIHPFVAKHFTESKQQWLESAILFESQFYKRIKIDVIICVIAPQEVCLERIIKRDRISKDQALAWIKKQMPQEEKANKSTYTLINDGVVNINTQIENILNDIKRTSK